MLPREAREGSSARVLVGVAARWPAVLVGWKPDEIYSKSPRLRTLILTREFESSGARARVGSKTLT